MYGFFSHSETPYNLTSFSSKSYQHPQEIGGGGVFFFQLCENLEKV